MLQDYAVSLRMMKFAVNQGYLFSSEQKAYWTGSLKFLSVLNIELASLGIIVAANDTISIVFNFIAVAIVAQFEEYFYMSLNGDMS